MRNAYFVLLLLLCAALVSAAKTDYWAEGVGKGIYERCAGSDIAITQPYLSYPNGTTVQNVSWPYPQQEVIGITRGLAKGEPYNRYFAGCDNQSGGSIQRNHSGCGILTCGENSLDINWMTWSWNGEEIQQPSAPVASNATVLENTTLPPEPRPTVTTTERKVFAIAIVALAVAVVVGLVSFGRSRKPTRRKTR